MHGQQPHRGLRRTYLLPVLALGIAFIWFGLNRWFQQSSARTTAIEYVQAVMLSDKEGILSHTHPHLRDKAERELGDFAFKKSERPEDYIIRVHHSRKTGEQDSLARLLNEDIVDSRMAAQLARPTMLVKVIVEKDGYQVKPEVHLEQFDDCEWYVTWVEDLEIDPRWQDHLDDLAAEQSE